MAGTDYYPVGAPATLDGISAVAKTTRKVAARHGSRPALVLQAFSWAQYGARAESPFPSRREMRRMRDNAIRHGSPSMLLWYAYNDLLNSNHPDANWRALKRAAFAPTGRERTGAGTTGVRTTGVKPRAPPPARRRG